MDRDTFILMAFCVFAFLAGIRLKQRFSERKKQAAGNVSKNQRPKSANADEPSEIAEKRIRREKRVKFFTMIQLVVLGGLMIYMIPALVRDFMVPGQVDALNMFLRCLIFVLTIYIFVLAYIKVFGRKQK